MGHCNCGDTCTIEEHPERGKGSLKKFVPAAISFVLLVAGISLDHAGWFAAPWIKLAWFIAAYVPVGVPVLIEAWDGLRRGKMFSEFMLMGIATIGAFLIGEYPEGVAVMLFYAIGELFQDIAVGKAKRNIGALLDVRPETAGVVRGGILETVSPYNVAVGETIEVVPGGRVPLDGTLESAATSFDTAALTGESAPRTIEKGGDVLAGMIAADSVVRIKVSKPFGQSALSRILRLVEEAAERKAPAEHFIRRFARIYTPAVVALAALIVVAPLVYSLFAPFDYVFDDWLYRGLVFLVISCPCALVISIPLGYFGGIGLASHNGILFKGSNYLDAITKVNNVVMDKTGTLTQGVFEVRQVVSNGIPERELVGIVASVERRSTHPIARAIVRYADSHSIPQVEVSGVTEIPGYGLSVEADGHKALVGNARLFDRFGVVYPPEIAEIPETVVMCAIDGRYAGYVLVADALKEDAARAISDLHKLGIGNIAVLSGDKQAIVSEMAARIGIKQAYGDLLPEGKVRYIEELKRDPYNKVAFVGDGINDAPALALSDIGIAMGGLGSDAAIETADVIIQTDHPSKIAAAIRIGRMTRRTVVQNIWLAFGVKFAVLVLGAGGMATLWGAVFADVGVALLAILNAMRLLHRKVG